MDFNRNQFFLIGLILLFVGIHFRRVEAFVLNKPASQFLVERLAETEAEITLVSSVGERQQIRHPQWLALALISVGVVFILQSLVMRRPEGGG